MEAYRGKRVFDLVSAGAACLICAPLVATIAAATVLEDGGPAFFVRRVWAGSDGHSRSTSSAVCATGR